MCRPDPETLSLFQAIQHLLDLRQVIGGPVPREFRKWLRQKTQVACNAMCDAQVDHIHLAHVCFEQAVVADGVDQARDATGVAVYQRDHIIVKELIPGSRDLQ